MDKLQIPALPHFDHSFFSFTGGGMQMALLSCVQVLEKLGLNTFLKEKEQ